MQGCGHRQNDRMTRLSLIMHCGIGKTLSTSGLAAIVQAEIVISKNTYRDRSYQFVYMITANVFRMLNLVRLGFDLRLNCIDEK